MLLAGFRGQENCGVLLQLYSNHVPDRISLIIKVRRKTWIMLNARRETGMKMGPNYASRERDALARLDHHISLTGHRSMRGDTYVEKICRPSHVDQLRTYVFQN